MGSAGRQQLPLQSHNPPLCGELRFLQRDDVPADHQGQFTLDRVSLPPTDKRSLWASKHRLCAGDNSRNATCERPISTKNPLQKVAFEEKFANGARGGTRCSCASSPSPVRKPIARPHSPPREAAAAATSLMGRPVPRNGLDAAGVLHAQARPGPCLRFGLRGAVRSLWCVCPVLLDRHG